MKGNHYLGLYKDECFPFLHRSVFTLAQVRLTLLNNFNSTQIFVNRLKEKKAWNFKVP